MYIIINKETNESAIIKDKTKVSAYIGRSVTTIYRKRNKLFWECGRYIVYNPRKIDIKSDRGGSRNFNQDY